MRDDGPRALLITGTVGAGKTITMQQVAVSLRAAAVPHAAIDMDAIRLFWPVAVDDAFGFEVGLRNLADLSRNYLANGAERLVIAGVCETPGQREHYSRAVRAPLRVCRLRVASHVVEQRLRRRHDADGADLEWHLQRAPALDAILDRSAVADVTVTVIHQRPGTVAREVMNAVGWAEP